MSEWREVFPGRTGRAKTKSEALTIIKSKGVRIVYVDDGLIVAGEGKGLIVWQRHMTKEELWREEF